MVVHGVEVSRFGNEFKTIVVVPKGSSAHVYACKGQWRVEAIVIAPVWPAEPSTGMSIQQQRHQACQRQLNCARRAKMLPLTHRNARCNGRSIFIGAEIILLLETIK